MEKINEVKVVVVSAAGFIGGLLAKLFGGWTGDLKALVLFMAVDFIMGLALAAVFKKSSKTENGALESKASWKGLCKKGTILLFVLVAHQLDKVTGLEYIRTAVIIGFLANELISIIENAGLMGVPLPSAITKAVEILKTKAEEN